MQNLRIELPAARKAIRLGLVRPIANFVRFAVVQMPPKKEEEVDVLLGRFGTSLKIGIVGLPNVGYVCVVLVMRHQLGSSSKLILAFL
jgi:hypothetical protein